MRDEKEMMDLIVGIAEKDERVRAVYMNGSRTNPNVERDIFQDYDVVYVVNETISFLNDREWISIFGDLTMIQYPYENDIAWGADHDFDCFFAILMLFKDGNRIDLGIETIKNALEGFSEDKYDKLTIVLLDKDNLLPKCPLPSDEDLWIKKPTEEQYYAHCNNFWWCLNNVARGIVRDQLPYAMWMYNVVVRDELEKMIEWHIGVVKKFELFVGNKGKLFKKYMSPEIYEMYKQTFSDSDYDNFWKAIFSACNLFKIISLQVGQHFGFTYKKEEETGMMEYLQWIKGINTIK